MTLRNTADTRLGYAVLPLARAHPGESGIVPLADGRDAFAARALLAAAAESTLDIQYYIWHGDMSGTLLFEALHRAADRGVRVRLLLDDNNTAGLDSTLAALDSHPNIEVRLFNPFVHRRWRYVDYITDFRRLNRRMHNKSMTADNQVTIIGGRNVGDEYFDAGQAPLFVDLDVLAIGPVVNDVSSDFDRYWASASAYPADRVLSTVAPARIADLTTAASLVERDPAARAYLQALAQLPFVRDLLAGQLHLEWAVTHMVSDDPAKGLGAATNGGLLWERLKRAIGTPASELELVSPYFVPGSGGVDAFAAMVRKGVQVSLLTNSLEATDVVAVHAGYAKRRKPLLEAGVRLFEMKREATGVVARNRAPTGSRGSGMTGSSSASSLHAKTFSMDRSRIFIGSFNFDPRSAHLNTEMGFVIESPELAQRVVDAFARGIPERAYEVRLTNSGSLEWVEQRDGREVVHTEEPGATFWTRAMVAVLSALPIEWLL
ncbi:MAG TPA: phospholipase D family protein [Gemmatimonadaceae bacterium]